MRNFFKCAIILLAMQFCASATFAQKRHTKPVSKKHTTIVQPDNSAFVGVWELTQLGSNDGQLMNTTPGALKIFSGDGKFSNVQYSQQGAVITHKGKFTIVDDKFYVEAIADEMEGATYALAGKTYKIGYQLSDDKRSITFNGAVEGKNGQPGLTYTEVWRKL